MASLLISLFGENTFARFYWFDAEEIYSAVPTPDGGYLLVGMNGLGGPTGEKCLLLKLDSFGSILWARLMENAGLSIATSISPLGDKSWFVAVERMYRNPYILKIRADSSIVWAKHLNGFCLDDPLTVLAASDGGALVICEPSSEIASIKPDGSLGWAKKLWDYYLTSGIGTPDGGFILVGNCKVESHKTAVLVVKLAPDGSIEWSRAYFYTTSTHARGLSIVPADGGGYVVLGKADRALLLKITEDGTLEWARQIGGDKASGSFTSIAKTSDGGYVLGGEFERRPALIKLTSEGLVEWAKVLDAEEIRGVDPEIPSVFQTSDGGYFLAGTWGFRTFVLKTGPEGSYPGCLTEFELYSLEIVLNVSIPTPRESLISVEIEDFVPSFVTRSLKVSEVCPASVGEGSPRAEGLRCLPRPGGLLFVAEEDTPLEVYSAEGRLVKRLVMSRGQVFLPLKPGVYFWKAGEHRGRGVVR